MYQWVRTFKDSRGHFAIGNHYREFPRVIPEGHFEVTREFLRPPKNACGQLYSQGPARIPYVPPEFPSYLKMSIWNYPWEFPMQYK